MSSKTRRIECLMGLVFLGACVLFAPGCATVPYRYGATYQTDLEYEMPEGEPQIEVGRPVAALDWVDWIWPGSLLGKLILWNHKIDSHEISPDTINALRKYLDANQLANVKVRINQYAPGGEWSRLFKNRAMGAGWRYTFGILANLGYTILPGRFFGGDNYNPYSNTVNIYSDIPAVALHEGGHAKDQANRKWKGTHAFLYMLPFTPLYYEYIATADAIGYTIAENIPDYERQAYHVTYPAYMTYVGGSVVTFVADPLVMVVQLGLVIPGHIVGRIKGAQVDD